MMDRYMTTGPSVVLRTIAVLALALSGLTEGAAQRVHEVLDVDSKTSLDLDGESAGYVLATHANPYIFMAEPALCGTHRIRERFELHIRFSVAEAFANSGTPFSQSIALKVSGTTQSVEQFSEVHVLEVTEEMPTNELRLDLTVERGQCEEIEVELDQAYTNVLPAPYDASTELVIEQHMWNRVGLVIIDSDYETTARDITNPDGNLLRFEWDNGFDNPCDLYYPAFEFQLLRLYNEEPGNQNNEESVSAVVDWSEALTIIVGDQAHKLDLLLTEGTGFYAWRVRPLSNWYDGGFVNPNNWGAWSDHGSFLQGDPVALTVDANLIDWNGDPGVVEGISSVDGEGIYAFYYHQFDRGRNWSHTRVFSEGSDEDGVAVRFGERMTFATGLQQVEQEQAFQSSVGEPVVTGTVLDYTGRPAVKSLPFPQQNKGSMGFIDNLLKEAGGTDPYRPEHFDTDLLYRDNDPMAQGANDPTWYYSPNNTAHDEVPHALGYPFTRTLFYPDGRPKQQSGPGSVLAFTQNSDPPPTAITYYGAITQTELVRVFGEEAYDIGSVHKVVTLDPNEVPAITFQDKEGKTLATALGKYSGTAMDPLESQATADFTVLQEATQVDELSDYVNEKTVEHVYVPGDGDEIEVTYDIDPLSIDPCYLECVTCDYTVEFFAYNKEYPDDNLVDDPGPFTFPDDLTDLACPTQADPYPAIVFTVELPEPGTYVFGRRIKVNNLIDEQPPLLDHLVLNDHLQAVAASYETMMDPVDYWITALETELADQNGDPGAVLGLLYDMYPADQNGIGHIPIEGPGDVPCGEITFEHIVCPACTATVDVLLDSLKSAYMAAYGIPADDPVWIPYPTTFAAMASLSPGFLDYPECGHPTAFTFDEAMFTEFIQNVNAAYECEQVLACWNGALSMYFNYLVQPIPPVDPNAIPNAGAWPGGAVPSVELHLIDIFLDCLGRELVGTASTADDSQDPGYLTHAHSHFYLDSNHPCLTLLDGVDINGSDIADGILYIADLAAVHVLAVDDNNDPVMQANGYSIVFDCINSHQAPDPGLTVQNVLDAQLTESITTCQTACGAHYDQFIQQLLALDNTLDPVADAADIECQWQAFLYSCWQHCAQLEFVGYELGPASAVDFFEGVLVGNLVLEEEVEGECPDMYGSVLPPPSGPFDMIDPAFVIDAENAEMPQLAAHLNTALDHTLGFIEHFEDGLETHMGWSSDDGVDFHWISPDHSFTFCELRITCALMVKPAAVISAQHLSSGKLRLEFLDLYDPADVGFHSIRITLNGTNEVFTFVHDGVNVSDDDDMTIALMVHADDHGFEPFTDVEGRFLPSPFGLAFEDADYTGTGMGSVSYSGYDDDTDCNHGVLQTSVLLTGQWGYYDEQNTNSQPYPDLVNCPVIIPTGWDWMTLYTDPTYDCQLEYPACTLAYCYSFVVGPTGVPEGPADTLEFQSCEDINATLVLAELHAARAIAIDMAQADFEQQYMTTCADPDNVQDILTIEATIAQHHFTLYYYDRAGNLMATIPPKGVVPLDMDETHVAAGAPYTTAEALGVATAHNMRSSYEHNSLGQVVKQTTPDGGVTRMIYDKLGRVRFSQNAKQAVGSPARYSYTIYDELGRVIEAGESDQEHMNNTLFVADADDAAAAEDMNFPSEAHYLTRTEYTLPASVTFPDGSPQRYLQNRVSYAYHDPDGDALTQDDRAYTYYSYDPHGNAEWLIQEIPGLGRHHMSYEYDLVAGRVLKVHYNQGRRDELHHRYAYDEDGRITHMETSRDQVIWERDAAYAYYPHGPLQRTTIGHDHVQGLDYSYTLQGWLKGINDPTLSQRDDGEDGYASGPNPTVGTDAFGMMLSYFSGDYMATASMYDQSDMEGLLDPTRQLFNGNIAAWASRSQLTGPSEYPVYQTGSTADPLAMSGTQADYFAGISGNRYFYDVLNRLRTTSWHHFSAPDDWIANANNDFGETFTYDANGNFETTVRFAWETSDNPGLLDNFDYHGVDEVNNNQLKYIDDPTPQTPWNDDLRDQDDQNYAYDPIGQLTKDDLADIDLIEWTPHGKVQQVTYGTSRQLRFGYDAAGQRIWKANIPDPNAAHPNADVITYYVRDAQGNPMATYVVTEVASTDPGVAYKKVVSLAEQPLYGSARVGTTGLADPVVAEILVLDTDDEVTVHPGLIIKHTNHQLDIVAAYTANQLSANGLSMPGPNVHGYDTHPADATDIDHNHMRPKGMDSRAMHRAEDLLGNTLFTVQAVAYNNTIDNTTIYDATGDPMWWNTALAPQAFDHATALISAQVPGEPDQYYLFSIGQNGKPYAVLIDMADQAHTRGAVQSVHELWTNGDGYQYGQALAVVDDRTGLGAPTLYLKRYASGDCQLLALDLAQLAQAGHVFSTGLLTELDEFTTADVLGKGEMQVSPTGGHLALVHRAPSMNMGPLTNGDWRIRVYSLGPDHTTAALVDEVERNDHFIHSVDFSPAGEYIYWTETGKTSTNKYTMGNLRRAELVDLTTSEALNAKGGDVRHTHDGLMLTIGNLATEVYTVTDPDGATPTASAAITPYIGQGKLLSHMALQPVIITNTVPVKERVLGHKHYELTDHLGNVRAVVSDMKYATWSGTAFEDYHAEVESRADYYAFGSLMPGRNAFPGDYRFGFNGKENDNEVHNAKGTSVDFDARMYDSRIGRWLKTDLLEAEMPGWTPYRFGFNNPIRFSDALGSFEIDEATAKAYPKLNAYLQNIAKVYQDKPEAFKKAFKQYGELTDAQVMKMLEYKLVANGSPTSANQPTPRIVVTPLLDANGETPIGGRTIRQNSIPSPGGPTGQLVGAFAGGVIKLDQGLITRVEDGTGSSYAELEGNMVLLESTLFHEATHYGDGMNGTVSQTSMKQNAKGDWIINAADNGSEGGKNFENAVYGMDIDSSNSTEYARKNNIGNAAILDELSPRVVLERDAPPTEPGPR